MAKLLSLFVLMDWMGSITIPSFIVILFSVELLYFVYYTCLGTLEIK